MGGKNVGHRVNRKKENIADLKCCFRYSYISKGCQNEDQP